MLLQMHHFIFNALVIFHCIYVSLSLFFFLIHLSVDGHVVCFHVLAIVNSAAVNIEVCVSF